MSGELPTDVTLLQKMVTDLRQEAAGWRTQSSKYRQAFGDYKDDEVDYLLDHIGRAGGDPDNAAQFFLDLGNRMKGVKPAETTEPEEADDMGVSLDDIKKLLEEQQEAEKAAAAEAENARIAEEVFSEIERETGFSRGSPEFDMVFSLAELHASQERPFEFSELGKQTRTALGIDDSGSDGDGEGGDGEDAPAAEGEPAPEGGTEGSTTEGTDFPVTADAGGSGKPLPQGEDWIGKAQAEGRNPMEVARERLEARLDNV